MRRMSVNSVNLGRSARLPFTKRAGAALVGGVAALATTGAMVATAAPPSFPDNIVVFPDRDFVTVEGYQDHIGETATLTVYRGSTAIGSAQSVVGPGDVAFEVNHPGGACWGAGTSLKVTPDIKAGDRVQISFPGLANGGDTTVQDAAVDTDTSLTGNVLTVTGHIADGVNSVQTEQRIVNPDLKDTEIGRRDIRAVPGAPSVETGYVSELDFSGDRFTATYTFDDAGTAAIAAGGGGERFMSWQVEDADANRQGLTIAEYGELGGPGMGGCPAGPADVDPTPGTYSAVRTGSSIQVNWEPATDVPAADPVTGYSVEAIAPAAGGEQKVIGTRTAASATRATLTVDAAQLNNYTVEVRSLAGAKLGTPFPKAATPPAQPLPGDTTVPKLTVTPGSGETDKVTLASESGADIYYTNDGSPVSSGGLPSDTAKLYTAPIAITAANTEIKAIAFDDAGNFTEGGGIYSPPSAAIPLPTAAATPTVTAGQGQVALKWAASAADQKVTGYQVTVYDAANTVLATQPAETADLQQTVTGLTGGTAYGFTVKAKNATGWGPESAKVTATPAVVTDRVTITRSQWKAGDFRVVGTSSQSVSPTLTGTVTVYRVNADGSRGSAIAGTRTPLVAAVAPATGSTFSVRVRAGAPTTNPGRVMVVSSFGGVSAPVQTTNG
jgi:hypothetical protein